MASIQIVCTVLALFSLGIVKSQEVPQNEVSLGDLFGVVEGLMKAFAPEEDAEECPQWRKNIQWMNGDKGFLGSGLESAEACQESCKTNVDYANRPCIGWSFWANSGPWHNAGTWCYLFSNEDLGNQSLESTEYSSPGAVSGLPMDCETELQEQIDEMTGMLSSFKIKTNESEVLPVDISAMASETDCVVEENTDYSGGDLYEYNGEELVANSNNKRAASKEECRDLCRAATNCNYWTFVKRWAIKCLLKTHIENKENRRGIVSGDVCRGEKN